MAQIAIMESQVDLKSSAERFYETFRTKTNMLSKMCPNIVKDVQLVKGSWYSVGSVKKWTLFPTENSAPEVSLILLEAVDEKNRSITMNIIDGAFKKLYSFYRFTIQVTGKGKEESGSTVKVTLEYEKMNANDPEPTKDFEFAAWLYKSIDAYLVKNE